MQAASIKLQVPMQPPVTKAQGKKGTKHSAWYVEAMKHLVEAVQALSQAHEVDEVTAIVREAARNLTGADGASFVLRDGEQCYYADENAIAPLWKGKRFPLSTCVSGWVMLNGTPAVIPDIYDDPRVPTEAYRPTFVKSMAMVPIRRNAPIGAIGNYWAHSHVPTDEEISILQALADTTSVALENAVLYDRLRQQVTTLEQQQKRIGSQHEALEVFTRALAHDLKEPVRTLQSFSHILHEDETLAEKPRRYARFIDEASQRMGLLINSVFVYTQLDDPESTAKAPCATKSVMRAVEANLAQLIHERGAIVTSGKLPELPANEVQMMQLLQNLVSNAIRHNKPQVAIHVDAVECEDDWIFSVSDNGVGIAQEDCARIFEPFKRLQPHKDCTGLGLAICNKIVSSHGGKIWCESAPGNGTVFYFTLPKTQTHAKTHSAPHARIAPVTPANRELLNILLVDDMEADIELARLIFNDTKRQCALHIAHDGTEALDMLKNRFKGGQVDMMLLDINMPGMNGFELLKRVKADAGLKDLPVYMCTGSTYERDRKMAKTLGAAGYITKPASLDAITAMLAEIPVTRLYGDNALSA